jgi:aminocarboxymuconate-semialdehyde decarboxylase
MKIDVHNHAFPQTVLELGEQEPAFGISVEDGMLKRPNFTDRELEPSSFDGNAKLEELAERGLDGAVICIEPTVLSYHQPLELGEAMCEAANRGLREMCEPDPTRLKWMAHVPLQDPERAAEVLRGAAADGAAGVEVGSSIDGRRLDERDFDPFWEAVELTGLTVFVHNAYNPKVPGLQDFHLVNVIGNLLETTICAERLVCAGTFDRHPRVRVVLAHGGGYFPYQAGRLRHAKTVRPELADSPADPWDYAGRLIFDTITHDIQALAFLISRAGADNVVVGTDLPYDMGTPRPMDELIEAVGVETAAIVAERNPERLYGFAA